VRAGLAAEAAHTVYFGIPVGARPERARAGRRLLWVGRLTPEKGLHLLLATLPRLRERMPEVTLTAVAAQGEGTYRALIERLIAEGGLGEAVTLRGPVPREELPALYASHDALFFYSINAEPVALVLMEAYANGLPVAANRAATDLVEDGVTCVTYEAGVGESIVEAVERVLADEALRARLADQARARVEERYSLAAMGTAYDRLLRG
jgi:glycogen(starch) synthase